MPDQPRQFARLADAAAVSRRATTARRSTARAPCSRDGDRTERAEAHQIAAAAPAMPHADQVERGIGLLMSLTSTDSARHPAA